MSEKFGRLIRTISYLHFRQMIGQLINRLPGKPYTHLQFKADVARPCNVEFIIKHHSLSEYHLAFLNQSSPFISWNDVSNGMLWAYNLNYMDWLVQKDISCEEGAVWIDRFIADLSENKVGLDPYPTALRIINWIKFISIHYDEIGHERLRVWNDSLYSQYIHLSRNLEYHLLGNHLLEDAYALFIASIYFSDEKRYNKVKRLLRRQLDEQVLNDGAHFEQSPMYHCILLDRLLDCCNFSFHNLRFRDQKEIDNFLKVAAVKMLGHLGSILYDDGTYPLFNDSASRVSPTPNQIFSYASALGIVWNKIQMDESGYRKLTNSEMEVFADVGNVTASYQPGHTHADTFTYELRIDGKPFVADTGISTYEKNERRQYERGTSAHNTVVVHGMDSSEVWSGFRLGKRARVAVISDTRNKIEACHDGYGKSNIHRRVFEIGDDFFRITDSVKSMCPAINYIHLASGIIVLETSQDRIITDLGILQIDNAQHVEVVENSISCEYNTLLPSYVIMVHFVGSMSYTIRKRQV